MLAPVLDASPLTFAQFSEVNGTNDFDFTNNGDGTGTFTAMSNVYFTFFANNIPALDVEQPLPSGPVLAILTRTGTVTGDATCVVTCTTGATVTQALTNSVLTIRLASTGALLLESSGTGAALVGTIGGSSLTLQNSDPPNQLTFTSDFVSFAGVTTTARAVSFSSVSSDLSIGSDGLLNSFTAAASGTFSDQYTPEPATWSTMLGALLVAVPVIWRRRQQ